MAKPSRINRLAFIVGDEEDGMCGRSSSYRRHGWCLGLGGDFGIGGLFGGSSVILGGNAKKPQVCPSTAMLTPSVQPKDPTSFLPKWLLFFLRALASLVIAYQFLHGDVSLTCPLNTHLAVWAANHHLKNPSAPSMSS